MTNPAPELEDVFLVRMRSIVGEVRVLDVRADVWPAIAVAERDEGFYADEVLLVGRAPREAVPFPLRLHAEPSRARDLQGSVRKASRVLERARSYCVAHPRRAQQAFRSIEPLFEEIGPDAAAAMWIDAARTFEAIGDVEHARLCLDRLALLARRAPVSPALLVREALEDAAIAIVPPALVDVAASQLPIAEGLSFRIAVLARQLDAAARVPAGTLLALDRSASASPDPTRARTQLDAAFLGMLGLPGTFSSQGEAPLLRARLVPLWVRSRQTPALADAAFARLRGVLDVLDADGLSAVLDFLLEADERSDAPLLASVVHRLLCVCPPGRFNSPLDRCLRALLRLAAVEAPLLRARATELGSALSLAFASPATRPLLAALLADLDAEAAPTDEGLLSEILDRSAGGSLGAAEARASSARGSYRRTDRERAFARWIPTTLAEPLRAGLAGGSVMSLVRAPALAFVACVRLLGLAQDERTERPLAEDALDLVEAILAHLEDDRSLAEVRPAEVDPTLELLEAADLEALRTGLALTRTNLGDRLFFRPERWPAPLVQGLSSARDARLVLLAWVLGRIDAREAGSHHLALTRIAAATPLVRAAAGRLVPSQQAIRGLAASPLARLVGRAVARLPGAHEASLRDVVLLCSPRSLAEVFAQAAGLPPRQFVPTTDTDEPLADRASPPPPAPLPAALDLDPRGPLAHLLAPLPRPPSATPTRDPALPLAPVIAGHPVSIGPRGEVVVFGARGTPLRRVPRAVQQDEAYRALIRGRHGERARKRREAARLEARMTSAIPLGADELAFLLDDPTLASLLRFLVVAKVAEDPRAPRSFFVLWAWDRSRGLGLVPLDYDARFVPFCPVEIVHPTRLPDLQAFRALLADLGVRQGLTQLFRDERAVAQDELDREESRALAGRLVASSAALLSALRAEGFSTGRGLPTRSFVHHDLPRPIVLWFDAGEPAWPSAPVISGPFGFRDEGGKPLGFRDVPWAIVCEARASLERALARAATRTR